MGVNCSTESKYFDVSIHGRRLPFMVAPALKQRQGVNESTEDKYNKIIKTIKEQQDFLFGEKSSSKRYAQAIINLQSELLAVIEKLATKLGLEETIPEFKSIFNDRFLSDSGVTYDTSTLIEEVEGPAMEGNPDMPNEEERIGKKMSDIVDEYYGIAVKANSYRKQQFGLDLTETAIIDTENGVIVRNSDDLNLNIITLKNRYFARIVEYLKSYDPNFKAVPAMFGPDGRVLRNYQQVFNKFYNIIKKLKSEGNIESQIISGWKKRISGETDLFYDALNSYVNLVYFDTILEDTVGKVIQVNNPAYKDDEWDFDYMKYGFSKGDEHKRKGFQNSENRDALKDIAKFSKLILSTIPIYSSINGKFLNRYVSVGSFANAISSLFINAYKLGNNYTTLQKAIVNFHENPYYYSGIIFKEISDNSTHIQNALRTIGVNQFNLNVLTSVYKHIYDTSNPRSIKSIETASTKKQFNINSYSIVDSINGVIDRTMDATYLQAVYSGENGIMEISEKPKFTDRRESFNILNNINNNNFYEGRTPEKRRELSEKYEVKKESGNIAYSVRIGNIRMTGRTSSKNGVLDPKPLILTFSDNRIDKIFSLDKSSIDLTSDEEVKKILLGKDLSEEQQLFRDVLEFVDTFLRTRILTPSGMEMLYQYSLYSESSNYINPMLQSALRAAIINNFNKQFDDGLANGKYKSLQDYEKFLKEIYVPFKSMNFNDPKYKAFVKNELGIPSLITVRTSDTWIDLWATTRKIISAEVSKSTTKDINNNAIANNRTSFLGGNLQYYLSKYKAAGQETATSPLLFTQNSSLVTRTLFNTDAKSRRGIKKSVKDMCASELFYSSIIYNFYGSYLQDEINKKSRAYNIHKSVLIQPTTYSDKTSFVTYAIKANKTINAPGKSYDGKTIFQLNTEETIDLYQDTVGAAYINLYNNVLDDLRTVLDMPTASFEEINAKLHTISQDELLTLADSKHIELQLDTHYRKFGKVCKFNELLYHYANDLYTDRNNLVKRFEREKINFVNDLIDSGVSFYTTYFDDSATTLGGNKSSNIISQIIKAMYNSDDRHIEQEQLYRNKWVKNNKLIFAKVTDKDGNVRDVLGGREIPADSKVELNPLFERYFYTDSLLANNLRFELTGSEVAHPDKAKINFTKELNNLGITELTNPEYFKQEKDKDGNIKYVAVDNFGDLIWLRNQSILNSVLKPMYENAILKVEAVAQGTQLKRNVIIPATLQYEQQNALNGIPPKMKVAVIDDTQAKIFNFRGDNTTEDAHDGSAYISPLISILENKALQDQEVGVDKKPIWHSFNPRLMSATLLKFATFTQTSERMRTSLKSDISLYKLFKQMHDLDWADLNEDGTAAKWNNTRGVEIDLVNSMGYKKNQNSKLNFLSDIIGDNPLFYEENGIHYQINGFGRDENGYFTNEVEVNSFGVRRPGDNGKKVYHRFDSQSNHFKYIEGESKIPPISKDLHDINSLFQLYNVMGGIYAESLIEDDKGLRKLTYSDAASYATVNFMNNISVRIGNDTSNLSQRTYYQPLKEMLIAYAANKSAVKNGISNLNSSEAWKGNMKLRYMTLDTDGLGIQMDADHEIDESEMTEFSQVISALEAGGRLHGEAKEVYKTLGQLAVQASKFEIDAATNYIHAKISTNKKYKGVTIDEIRSELYDIFARTIINNYKQKEDRVDLTVSIIAKIKSTFNLNDDHSLDEFKLPNSDNSLYSQIIPTFVSSINSKSIKRKYPGSGCVMVPGYGIIQNYKYKGQIKQFDDVLKEARNFNKMSKYQFFRVFDPSKETITDYNYNLVTAYLGEIQKEEWAKATDSIEQFMPTDKVDVLADGIYLTTIDLNDINDYYAFQGFSLEHPDGDSATRDIIRRGLIYEKTGIDVNAAKLTYAINVTQPRDLAPARLRWKYRDANGVEHTENIFNTKPVRDSFMRKGDKTFDSKKNRKLIQAVFDQLDKGLYQNLPIYDFENEAAELVISNMYATKFNAKGLSLSEILNRGAKHFELGNMPIQSKHYDLVFTTNSGNHQYVSFKTPKTDEENNFRTKDVGWRYIKPIGNDVYATTKDGQKLYKVGTYVVRKDLKVFGKRFVDNKGDTYDDKGNKLDQDGNTVGQVKKHKLRVNTKGQVLEYKEFISHYKVTESVQKKGSGGHAKQYDLYVVNIKNIQEGQYNWTEESVNKQIASILSNVYRSSDFNGIQLNGRIYSETASRLANVLPKMNVPQDIEDLLKNTVEKYLSNIDTKQVLHVIGEDYRKDLKYFYNLSRDSLYSSFLKSLTFTASRIPAQTLQSFMQMKAVGFTQSSKNIAYVSHWQTWLQGSDY